MSSVADGLLDDFTRACQARPVNVEDCQNLLLQLKLQLMTFQLIPPFTDKIETTRKQLLIARETLELGAGLAIECKDMDAFGRQFAQLRSYYADYHNLLPDSLRQWPLSGAFLLSLLCQNRIDEFHSELELIPVERRIDPCIAFPIDLEQSLMEGSYHKVLNVPVPRPQFAFFVHNLSQTVRERIAECCEKAYASVLLEDAAPLLMLDDARTRETIAQRGWKLADNVLQFPQEPDLSLDIPNQRMIAQTLSYAMELERIV
jgi:26S proteasome regulatory subunit N12